MLPDISSNRFPKELWTVCSQVRNPIIFRLIAGRHRLRTAGCIVIIMPFSIFKPGFEKWLGAGQGALGAMTRDHPKSPGNASSERRSGCLPNAGTRHHCPGCCRSGAGEPSRNKLSFRRQRRALPRGPTGDYSSAYRAPTRTCR